MAISPHEVVIVPAIPSPNQDKPASARLSNLPRSQLNRSRPQFQAAESGKHTVWNSLSQDRPALLRWLLILTLFFSTPGVCREMGAEIMLPDMGDPSGTVLSSADERRLGEAFMREARARIDIIDEPEISSYLENLGYRLVSHSETTSVAMGTTSTNTNFTFFAIRDRAINAFAVPGGYIGVNAGLILNTETESELAAVLGHEIAHIRQHHIARAIQLGSNMNPLTIAGILAGIIIGTQNPEAGRATMATVAAGTAQKQIDFTRANEEEADRLGIRILHLAGFDPRAVPDFFERLQTAHRYYRSPPEFLSTHPVTLSRIADSRNRAEQYPYRQYADTLEYHLVRAHLAVMMEPNANKSIRYFQNALQNGKYRNRVATRYGLALAFMAARKWQKAKRQIAGLLESNPEHVIFLARLADIQLASGQITRATRAYADALLLHPDHKLLTLGYARALLQANKPKKVIALLDNQRQRHRNPALQELLAKAFAQAGDRTNANAALSEHHYLRGDLEAAIRQLRIALKTSAGDFYQSSRIEARLEQFQQERLLRMKQ
uniref:Putative beta-barrel assembly-enhancing protease n=1 Tax=Candidatus Kentrum sp. MB TaxID=2138164 RepID=A0A450XRX1_9GAMM|nr:MAG: Putative Zn-dependent protease, contains TPR repeats [Candidatus Kentron sp. MB]VFK32030.1 MAG: Putative Zn-dependent protease, contains TPR repeats [Candidatus Kentron sp. MB]VFK75673.1 MAG: Putative Zn-dependent protease, contains TPR repeats [Candidatus Kentron sp. MB]